MVFADDECFHVSCSVKHCKQTSEGNITEEELV